MAAFLSTTTEGELTVADILALADQLRRRKVPRDKPVRVTLTDNSVILQVPIRVKIIPAQPRPDIRQPMRAAKRKR